MTTKSLACKCFADKKHLKTAGKVKFLTAQEQKIVLLALFLLIVGMSVKALRSSGWNISGCCGVEYEVKEHANP